MMNDGLNDKLLPEEDPIVKLDVFEGPLDLLLHLVKVNEVNILDLPMELVTRQYLATLRAMGKMELPLIGEYFVMAAELLKIKSQMLLPRGSAISSTTTEEIAANAGQDPRAELVRQLLDYQRLKKNVSLLEARIDAQALAYPCLKPFTAAARPLKQVDRFELMGSYSVLMRRLMERIAVGEIALDPHTVTQAIENILRALEEKPQQSFGALLHHGPQELGWIAAMFVGILELTRLGEIDLSQDEIHGEIMVARRVKAPETPQPVAV